MTFVAILRMRPLVVITPGACFGPWSARGCQHDAGSMQFRRAHLIGVLELVGRQQSRPRHRRNRVPGGPRRPAVRQATDKASEVYAAWEVTDGSIQNTVPSRHIRCRITPIRRASATIARLRPRRRATCAAHALSQVARPRCIITVAAWHKARRRFTSPALVIPPDTSRSPD